MNELTKPEKVAIREICKNEGHNPSDENHATYGDWPMSIFPCRRGCGTVTLSLSDKSAGLTDVANYLEGYAGSGMSFSMTRLEIEVSPS